MEEKPRIKIRLRMVIVKIEKLQEDFKEGFTNLGEYVGRMDK